MPARIVSEATGDTTLREAEIRRRAAAMLALLQLEKMELSVLLTGDDQIQKLNRIYRAKDRPTDVLAFAMREGDFSALAGELLGDVIVSIPTAQRQADERGVVLLAEVTMLIAHGLLHLLGWDHETERKDRAMRAEVERLCAAAARPSKKAPKKKSARVAKTVTKKKSTEVTEKKTSKSSRASSKPRKRVPQRREGARRLT